MAAPFPDAQIAPLIYTALGILLGLVAALAVYIRRLHKKIETGEHGYPGKDLRVDNIDLSKKSQNLMEIIIEEPELQSDLPDRMEVSKATVSNAVSELKERKLVKRKKRGNTYLIEPDLEELEDQQK